MQIKIPVRRVIAVVLGEDLAVSVDIGLFDVVVIIVQHDKYCRQLRGDINYIFLRSRCLAVAGLLEDAVAKWVVFELNGIAAVLAGA